MPLTKEQFIEREAKRNKVPPELFLLMLERRRRFVDKCDCGKEECEGWQIGYEFAWEKDVDNILKGIDKTDSDDENGWWETSTGAEFGKDKLGELKACIFRIAVSKEQFLERYAKNSKRTLEEIKEEGVLVTKCDCGDPECMGWQIERKEDPQK